MGASASVKERRKSLESVVNQENKPLNASDVKDVATAKREIMLLRKMAKSKKCAAGALESLRPEDAGDIMTLEDGVAEVSRLRTVFAEQTEFMVVEGALPDEYWDHRKKGVLTDTEMTDLALRTRKRLSDVEINALYRHFNTISGILEDDGFIDQGEFAAALGFAQKDNYILQRIFHVIDVNGDGQLNFAEFAVGLSHLCSRAPEQDRLYFSFSMYDVENKGSLSKSTVFELLKRCLGSTEHFPYKFSDSQIKRLVEVTFTQADMNHNGIINFAEYMRMVPEHPMMLHQMSLNITQAIMERASSVLRPAK